MEKKNVDMFMMSKGKYFSPDQTVFLQEKLMESDDSRYGRLVAYDFKDPNVYLLISFLGGWLGIDRFLIGQTGLGIAKLLTAGGCGIWWLVDLFLIMDLTRKKNFDDFNRFV